jgi:flagellar biosynthesis/type III secretory pathway M-ring protein FliF/YscJ
MADHIKAYGPLTAVLLATLLFFFMVVRPLVSAVARAATPPEPLVLETAGGGGGVLDSQDGDGEQREASRNLTERLRTMVDNFENVDAADLNRLVDLEQEATAQVLRRWIRDN